MNSLEFGTLPSDNTSFLIDITRKHEFLNFSLVFCTGFLSLGINALLLIIFGMKGGVLVGQ